MCARTRKSRRANAVASRTTRIFKATAAVVGAERASKPNFFTSGGECLLSAAYILPGFLLRKGRDTLLSGRKLCNFSFYPNIRIGILVKTQIFSYFCAKLKKCLQRTTFYGIIIGHEMCRYALMREVAGRFEPGNFRGVCPIYKPGEKT